MTSGAFGNRILLLAYVVTLVLLPFKALADISIKETVLQEGIFRLPSQDPSCADAEKAGLSCDCQSNVRYPVVEGMTNKQVQDRLNDRFRRFAQLFTCTGELQSEADNPERLMIRRTMVYRITFQSEDFLSLLFTTYTRTLDTNSSVLGQEGWLLDLKTGQKVEPHQVIRKSDWKINRHVFKLLAQPESIGPRIVDYTEKTKSDFFSNGRCLYPCSYIVDGQGLHLLFAPGTIHPMLSTLVDVVLDSHFLRTIKVDKAVMHAVEKATASRPGGKK